MDLCASTQLLETEREFEWLPPLHEKLNKTFVTCGGTTEPPSKQFELWRPPASRSHLPPLTRWTINSYASCRPELSSDRPALVQVPMRNNFLSPTPLRSRPSWISVMLQAPGRSWRKKTRIAESNQSKPKMTEVLEWIFFTSFIREGQQSLFPKGQNDNGVSALQQYHSSAALTSCASQMKRAGDLLFKVQSSVFLSRSPACWPEPSGAAGGWTPAARGGASWPLGRAAGWTRPPRTPAWAPWPGSAASRAAAPLGLRLTQDTKTTIQSHTDHVRNGSSCSRGLFFSLFEPKRCSWLVETFASQQRV